MYRIGSLLFLLPVLLYAKAESFDLTSRHFKLTPDAQVSIPHLVQSKKIVIRSSRQGYLMFVDASVVFNLSAAQFVKAITHYNRYVAWRVPTLKVVQVLSHHKQQQFLVWNWLSILGVTSKHCIRSSVHQLDPQTTAVVWKLVTCPAADQIPPTARPAKYANAPSFRDLHGSFYIKTLKTNKGAKPRIYVRYYTVTQLKKTIPPSIVHLISKLRLKSDIRKMLKAFAQNAAP